MPIPLRPAALAALALLPCPLLASETIDFEDVPAGTILSEVFTDAGTGPVLVMGHNPSLGEPNAAVVFDSAHPTGNDFDLGTPNEDFGGPGIGSGGEAGSPFANDVPRGHLLIVAEDLVLNDDGLVADPDDADVVGSTLTFDFSEIGPVTMHSLVLLDLETNRPDSNVVLQDANGNTLAVVPLPQPGDNGVAVVDLGSVARVGKMVVTLNGSSAIDAIEFDPPCLGSIGDLVWSDLDGDGIQDAGEPGIADVRLVLSDEGGNEIADTHTGPDGTYGFDGLCAGTYVVSVDESTLPEGFEVSPCDAGTDDAADNDCSPASVVLPHHDSHDPTVDFGYRPVPIVFCPPTPNSSGGTGEISWDGNPSISENSFSLTASGLPAGQPAIWFYGTDQAEVPFGNGFRCIGGHLTRFEKMFIGLDGTATVTLDFTQPPLCCGSGQVHPGIPVYFQLWFRDPAAGGANFSTSRALCVTFAP